MTERSVSHGTFAIERTYDASPPRVFAAWADPAAKARWFVGPEGWKELRREIDFRVGGQERLSGARPDGRVSDFDGRYHDIVADRRIVYSYAMHIDETRISVSLATVELAPAGAGNAADLHRAGGLPRRFSTGRPGASRARGALLDQLGAALRDAS